MNTSQNPIVETYSRLADEYDDESNLRSCWGRASEKALQSLVIKDDDSMVVDVGCGTGRALLHLAMRNHEQIQFVGIDPAQNMRAHARQRTVSHPNVRILDGNFENIPLANNSVDYLYSIFAFHWATDLVAAVKEISRVLRPAARMDLYFIGRNNGREFIRVTTPIFLKYMGPALLLESVKMRKQLRMGEAFQLFSTMFDPSRLTVEESYQTYLDTLDGHLAWWVRIEGHFMLIPPDKKRQCEMEVESALQSLSTSDGIPYTIHQLHVKYRNRGQSV